MKTQVLNEEGLSTYDQEIKDYIKTLRSEILQTYEIASVDEINNYLGIEVI